MSYISNFYDNKKAKMQRPATHFINNVGTKTVFWKDEDGDVAEVRISAHGAESDRVYARLTEENAIAVVSINNLFIEDPRLTKTTENQLAQECYRLAEAYANHYAENPHDVSDINFSDPNLAY